MIVVTGAAGFIGSAVIWGLNLRKEHDILAVDTIDDPQKKLNLAPLKYTGTVEKDAFRDQLCTGKYKGLRAIFHLGAISSTTENNWELLNDVNVQYSKDIIEYCVQKNIRIIYASSAAVYGDGSSGYTDSEQMFEALQPLNLYGRSKLLVDTWARDKGFLKRAVGLRYFNVFGPNEYHKGTMQSVIAKSFPLAYERGEIRLFKSYNPAYAHGEQKRDFVYIKDVVRATLFFLDHSAQSGIFNIGTGVARSWNDVAHALFSALNKKGTITYVDMPEALRGQYQYFTEANISKLRAAGCNDSFETLEDSITNYVQDYLLGNHHL